MITEHNYGDPIPLNREEYVISNNLEHYLCRIWKVYSTILSLSGEDGHMSFEAIRQELTKRIFLFLGLPALVLFGSILWLAVDWPGFFSAWIRAKFSDRRKRTKGALSTNISAQK